MDIFVNIYNHDSRFLCHPIQPSSNCSVPSAICAVLPRPTSSSSSFFSCQLLNYSFHFSKLHFSSLLGQSSCLAQEEDSMLFAPHSTRSEPSGKEASLHVTAKFRFLFLFLQNSFQNSWLPSFRFILPRQYFKNIISFSSLFCPV